MNNQKKVVGIVGWFVCAILVVALFIYACISPETGVGLAFVVLAVIACAVAILIELCVNFYIGLCAQIAATHRVYNTPEFKWNMGWFVTSQPRTMEKDGIVYEETLASRKKAIVDIWGDLHPVK